ncbi:MAG: gamma-butyrobetaine hydroxylase-like domain-containing protein, partial [Anaerolineae bacterium]
MNEIRATGVKADRNERVLTITWSDGKACRYPFAGLRAICPCVECKGGHENMGAPPDETLLRSARNDDLNL